MRLLTFALAAALVSYVGAAAEALLSWNISAFAGKDNKGGLKILDRVVGFARKGKVHAILGPSGSGKTSMLLALSETVPTKSLRLFGTLDHAEGSEIEILFVPQEDLLFAQLSAFETLETSAALRAPLDSRSTRTNIVQETLFSLGLEKVSATPVGDAKTRGLSGGEKKRLAIAQQLIGSRKGEKDLLIFADECTSGLDAFQAKNVVNLLRDMADRNGHTIITTIHQPRASVYELFDDITLLSEGRVVYSGAREELAGWFKSLGHTCPRSSTPAEYFLDLVSVDFSSRDAEKESRARLHRLANAWLERQKTSQSQSSSSSSGSSEKSAVVPRRRLSPLRRVRRIVSQFGTLFLRSFRQVTRDKPLNIARFMSGLFSALLFGSIYTQLGPGAGTVPDRLGLLQVAAVNTAMTSLIKATTSFVQEKLIINRERRSIAYPVLPYFVAKLAAEAPLAAVFPCMTGAIIYKLCGLNNSPGRLLQFLQILVAESFASSSLGMLVGSFATSVDSAIAVAPSVMVIFIVFGGLYIVNVPKWLSFVPKISLIKNAYEALCVNEFDGLELIPEAKFGPKSASQGSQILESLGYSSSSVAKALRMQGAIIAFNYLATLLSLLLQKPKFEKIRPYPSAPVSESVEVVAREIESSSEGDDALLRSGSSATLSRETLPQGVGKFHRVG